MQVNEVIQDIYADSPDAILSPSELRKRFAKNGYSDFYRDLPDALYYGLLDSLESPQFDSEGKRKREKTALGVNKNKDSVKVYQAFVEQAKLRASTAQKQPRIAVITASSRDPFEVADFYFSVFTDAGAEVIWLPLDKTYRQARELENMGGEGCKKLEHLRANNNSFYRADIYPERTARQFEMCRQPQTMLEQLQSVQGVFFNGGDQSLTLAALKYSDNSDSEELALIKRKVEAGEMIVGGTSAGTAVQAGGAFNQIPVAMLTNGHSSLAMKRGAFASPPPSQRCSTKKGCGQGLLGEDLTFRAQGGTGLFNLGLMDTHFSERDRETRLAVFTHVTGQRLGFGVDEATALLVGSGENGKTTHFSVVGQSGVFIVDAQVSHMTTKRGFGEHSLQRELSGTSHYLNRGSKATFDLITQQWTFQLAGRQLSSKHKLSAGEKGKWRNMTRLQCGDAGEIAWQQYSNQYRIKGSQVTQFYFDQDGDHCSYSNLPFVISYTQTE